MQYLPSSILLSLTLWLQLLSDIQMFSPSSWWCWSLSVCDLWYVFYRNRVVTMYNSTVQDNVSHACGCLLYKPLPFLTSFFSFTLKSFFLWMKHVDILEKTGKGANVLCSEFVLVTSAYCCSKLGRARVYFFMDTVRRWWRYVAAPCSRVLVIN